MILGVGAAQVDAISYLKAAGWWVAGCGNRQAGPALSLVDRFELIDIADVDALEEAGRRLKIDLVYSVGSDLAMPSVAVVVERLGLPGFVSRETAECMQDKIALRDFLADSGVSPVNFRAVSCEADLNTWSSYPAIIKPSDSQGQRGICRVESHSEAVAGLAAALGFSRRKTAIIEEWLDGPEVSANVFVLNGRIVVNEISDRLVMHGLDGGIPRGHVYPSLHCQGETLTKTRNLVESCVLALGIMNGPVYFQIKLDPRAPRVVEITPRLDGCHLWRLIKTVRRIDLLDACFSLLAGAPVFFPAAGGEASPARLMFFHSPPGEVFHATQACLPPADALYSECYLREGQWVPEVNGRLEKIGYYIAMGAP
jgi:biotin carboxylase